MVMRLYFARHAHALDGADDAARPLSARGREQCEVMGRFLAQAGVKFDAAYASPLVRADQTGKLILGQTGGVKMERAEALLNETAEGEWNRWLGALAEGEHVLLVGHAPSLAERVRALLMMTHPAAFQMSKGSVACVETDDRRSGRLKYYITPKSLGLQNHVGAA